MKDRTTDEAYEALWRSYEAANKRIKELEVQADHLRLTISKLEALLIEGYEAIKNPAENGFGRINTMTPISKEEDSEPSTLLDVSPMFRLVG